MTLKHSHSMKMEHIIIYIYSDYRDESSGHYYIDGNHLYYHVPEDYVVDCHYFPETKVLIHHGGSYYIKEGDTEE